MTGVWEVGRGGGGPVSGIDALAGESASVACGGKVAGDALVEVGCMDTGWGGISCGSARRLDMLVRDKEDGARC